VVPSFEKFEKTYRYLIILYIHMYMYIAYILFWTLGKNVF